MNLLFENSKLGNPKGTNRIYVVHGKTAFYRHFYRGSVEGIVMEGRTSYSVPLLTKQIE